MYSCKCDKSSTCRVSPFGYQGIYACLRLPLAFRSLPRPSSALGALASTLCSSSLNYYPETSLLSSGQLTFQLQLVFLDFFSRLTYVQLSRCAGVFRPSRILFGILKTIQRMRRQLFLRTAWLPFLCAYRSLAFARRSFRAVSFTDLSAIDLGLKAPISLRLAP